MLDSATLALKMIPNGENNIGIVFAVSISVVLDTGVLLMTMLKNIKKLT